MSNEPYETYSLAPYYRIRDYGNKPGTLYQKIAYHTFGATLYVSIHLVSSLLIYSSTQHFTFAYTVGLLYFFVSSILHYNQCQGVYVVDLETGTQSNTNSYPEPKTNEKTEATPKESEASCKTD